jgi:predicted small metal-binding protein
MKIKIKECKSHGPSHNILRHVPIIPRIQRIFCCKDLVVLHGWHASHKSDLGVMYIRMDLITMKHIEDTWIDKLKDEIRIF